MEPPLGGSFFVYIWGMLLALWERILLRFVMLNCYKAYDL